MFKSYFMAKTGKNQSPNEISSAEVERKKAARTDAFLAVIIDALTSIAKSKPGQAAASISYYSLFSIFPLILFMVVVLSYFLEISMIQREIIVFLENFIPGSETIVIENIQNILSSRLTTSITAAITLLWSGSGALNSIIANIHMAWPETRGRGFFVNRFFAITAIILICIVLTGTIIFSMVFNISDALAFFDIRVNKFLQVFVKIISSVILPLVLIYFATYLLYYFVPTAKVDKLGARIGALVTTVSWRVFTSIFSAYVLSPFNSYDVIYGSVATIILLLLYVYIMAFIILFCAHLVAAITHYKAKQTERVLKSGGYGLTELLVTEPHVPEEKGGSDANSVENTGSDKTGFTSLKNKSAVDLRKFQKNINLSLERLPVRRRTTSQGPAENQSEPTSESTFTNQAKKIISQLIHSLFRWK